MGKVDLITVKRRVVRLGHEQVNIPGHALVGFFNGEARLTPEMAQAACEMDLAYCDDPEFLYSYVPQDAGVTALPSSLVVEEPTDDTLPEDDE